MKQFNADKFFASFEITLKAIREAERITKDALRSLSRELLEQIHFESKLQGDIQPLNRLMEVLTPMNKKTLALFMQEFSGFKYDEELGLFGKKDKNAYQAALKKAIEALEDPHFNLWTWAERNIKVEKKTFKLETLGKDVKKAMEEKDDNGVPVYSKGDILKAVMAGGLTVDDLIQVLEEMDVVEVKA